MENNSKLDMKLNAKTHKQFAMAFLIAEVHGKIDLIIQENQSKNFTSKQIIKFLIDLSQEIDKRMSSILD